MMIYVLGHTPAEMAAIPSLPHVVPIDLTRLDANNDLAESRFFHYPPLLKAEYIGLATWRWDTKYQCLRLANLPSLDSAPNVVWCAHLSGADWPQYSEGCHPGMAEIICEIARWLGERPFVKAPWSNNIIAHRDIIEGLAAHHRRWWPRIIERWGPRPPYASPDDGRHGSYLAERLSMLFLQQFDCRQIPDSIRC